jgi:hypothetical protein
LRRARTSNQCRSTRRRTACPRTAPRPSKQTAWGWAAVRAEGSGARGRARRPAWTLTRATARLRGCGRRGGGGAVRRQRGQGPQAALCQRATGHPRRRRTHRRAHRACGRPSRIWQGARGRLASTRRRGLVCGVLPPGTQGPDRKKTM